MGPYEDYYDRHWVAPEIRTIFWCLVGIFILTLFFQVPQGYNKLGLELGSFTLVALWALFFYHSCKLHQKNYDAMKAMELELSKAIGYPEISIFLKRYEGFALGFADAQRIVILNSKGEIVHELTPDNIHSAEVLVDSQVSVNSRTTGVGIGYGGFSVSNYKTDVSVDEKITGLRVRHYVNSENGSIIDIGFACLEHANAWYEFILRSWEE